MYPTLFDKMHTTTLAQSQLSIALPENFPATIDGSQEMSIKNRIDSFDLDKVAPEQIATLGQDQTNSLNRVLDGFLDQINKAETPQIFKLVDSLSQEVAKEKIGELAEQILSAKPGLVDWFLGMFSKKALQSGLDNAYETLGRISRAKSKSLSDVVTSMEQKLRIEMEKLRKEIRTLDSLVIEYRKAFVGFAIEVAFLHNALAKAKQQMPHLIAAAGNDLARQQELQDKLQNLESVALSREAMMTRMPAEQLIIRQLQNAGISTLQELSITMGDRFASIRMTLIGIHGANLVRGVQRLNQANTVLDNQLQEARSKLMNSVVTTASNLPGDNRLQQANNLKRVVADTQELQKIVEAARETNKLKFEEARATMSGVRQELLQLGMTIVPQQN